MPPHLFVEQGRIKDAKFTLGSDRMLWRIGREKDCEILLPDDTAYPKVSRRHAVITCVDGKYYIKDGDGDRRKSHNRTMVNDEYVDLPSRKLLKHNDVIQICSYVLTFHDNLPLPDADSPSTVILATADPGDEGDSSGVQAADKFKEIINLLRHSFDLDSLLARVVESLLNTFKRAERSFVILVNEATRKADRIREYKARVAEVGAPRPYSQKIVDQCLLAKDAQRNSDPAVSRRSVCAPLLTGAGEAFGVLLLDTTSKKDFYANDLRELEALANHVSFAFANTHYHKAAVELAERKRDLVLAAEVVKSFLPERLPEIPGYEFFAAYEPVVEVGGDYYDFVPLGGNRLGILVADVAGHGVPAALVMTRFSAQVRACLPTETDLASAVRHLNSLAQPLTGIEKFITLAVLQLDPVAHTVTLVNAGHPAPLLVRRSSGAVEEKNSRACHGPMLGALEGYEYEAYQFGLEPGDTLIVYSDGMDVALEAESVRPRPFSTEGLRRAVEGSRAAPRELGEQVLRAWDKHVAGCRQHDDITLVCFGRTL
jgi:serine phosphatase RsbU (regulator of sigma subunit)